MSVLDQQRGEQTHIDRNWHRPAWACVWLAVLGALLGGAIWLQAGGVTKPNTKKFPTPVPPVPLRFGFYDLQGRQVAGDPVLASMAEKKLDYLILQNVRDSDGSSILQMVNPPHRSALAVASSNGSWIFSRTPLIAGPAEIEADGQAVGTWISTAAAGRAFRILSATVPADAAAVAAIKAIQAAAINPSHGDANPIPAVVSLSVHSVLPGNDLVQQATGLFDAGAVFWRLPISTGEMPQANHLLFSSGWSCIGGEVVRDPHDPLHRTGWIVSTAGAASPATHPAGEGDD